MKRLITIAILLGVAGSFMGCATTPVIGPVSYYTSQSNKKASIKRAALKSQAISAEQKAKIFKLTAHSSNPNEIAVSVGVDVLELVNGDYTTREVLKQLAGVAADGGIYALIYSAAKSMSEDDKSESRGNVSISVDDSANTSISVGTDGDDQTTTTSTDNSDHSDRSNTN